MDRLASGDRAAFDPLFRALWRRAIATARRRLEPAGASDAAQATMMKLFARAPEFTRGAPVLPWFYAIAANEVRAVERGVKRHAGVGGGGGAGAGADAGAGAGAGAGVGIEESIAADVGDPESLAVERELRAAVAQAVQSLDAPSAEAIAALLGEGERPAIDDAAFRKRVSRAYAKLRVLLGVGGHVER
jgi:RNA polymerase sigma-70 factor (ECF subfamily)